MALSLFEQWQAGFSDISKNIQCNQALLLPVTTVTSSCLPPYHHLHGVPIVEGRGAQAGLRPRKRSWRFLGPPLPRWRSPVPPQQAPHPPTSRNASGECGPRTGPRGWGRAVSRAEVHGATNIAGYGDEERKGRNATCSRLLYAPALSSACALRLPHSATGKCSSRAPGRAPEPALIIAASTRATAS